MSIIEILSLIFIALGEICIIVSIFGIYKLVYVMNRMHAATIADTLGTLLVFVGVMLYFGFSMVTAKLFLVLLFQWLTAPVTGHMIAQMCWIVNPQGVDKHVEMTFERGEDD